MPANIKGKGKKYGRSGMVAYKYGGHRVPGMFQPGGQPQSKPTPPPRFDPYTYFGTEQEYNAWRSAGSPEISTYKPTKIKFPTQPVTEEGMSPFNPPVSNRNIIPTPPPPPPTGPINPMQVIRKRNPWKEKEIKRGGSIRKRGGSVGSNGML